MSDSERQALDTLKKIARAKGLSVNDFLMSFNRDELTNDMITQIRQEAKVQANMFITKLATLPNINTHSAVDWKEMFRKLFTTYHGLAEVLETLGPNSSSKDEISYGNRVIQGKSATEFAVSLSTNIYLYIHNNKSDIVGEKSSLIEYVVTVNELAKNDPRLTERIRDVIKSILNIGKTGDENECRKDLQDLVSDYKTKEIVKFLNLDLIEVIAYNNLANVSGNQKLYYKNLKLAFQKDNKQLKVAEIWVKMKDAHEFKDQGEKKLNVVKNDKNKYKGKKLKGKNSNGKVNGNVVDFMPESEESEQE